MIDRNLDIPLEVLLPNCEDIATRFDMETLLLLVEHFGGLSFWVPANWSRDHILNEIGEDKARELFWHYGRTELSIPKTIFTPVGLRHMIKKLAAEGKSNIEIARALNISMRTLRDCARPVKNRYVRFHDPRQIDLEDYLK